MVSLCATASSWPCLQQRGPGWVLALVLALAQRCPEQAAARGRRGRGRRLVQVAEQAARLRLRWRLRLGGREEPAAALGLRRLLRLAGRVPKEAAAGVDAQRVGAPKACHARQLRLGVLCGAHVEPGSGSRTTSQQSRSQAGGRVWSAWSCFPSQL